MSLEEKSERKGSMRGQVDMKRVMGAFYLFMRHIPKGLRHLVLFDVNSMILLNSEVTPSKKKKAEDVSLFRNGVGQINTDTKNEIKRSATNFLHEEKLINKGILSFYNKRIRQTFKRADLVL